jgi:hypothetical protein
MNAAPGAAAGPVDIPCNTLLTLPVRVVHVTSASASIVAGSPCATIYLLYEMEVAGTHHTREPPACPLLPLRSAGGPVLNPQGPRAAGACGIGRQAVHAGRRCVMLPPRGLCYSVAEWLHVLVGWSDHLASGLSPCSSISLPAGGCCCPAAHNTHTHQGYVHTACCCCIAVRALHAVAQLLTAGARRVGLGRGMQAAPLAGGGCNTRWGRAQPCLW